MCTHARRFQTLYREITYVDAYTHVYSDTYVLYVLQSVIERLSKYLSNLYLYLHHDLYLHPYLCFSRGLQHIHACMHAYINTYIRTYLYACIHACIHTHVHTHRHTHAYTHTYTHTHTHTHTYIHTYIQITHTYIQTDRHTYVQTYVQADIHINIHDTCIHACSYTCVHTQSIHTYMHDTSAYMRTEVSFVSSATSTRYYLYQPEEHQHIYPNPPAKNSSASAELPRHQFEPLYFTILYNTILYFIIRYCTVLHDCILYRRDCFSTPQPL